MVDALVWFHDLKALTRAEVVDLLGEPHNGPKFTEYDLVYPLGPESGLVRLDYEWLVMRTDERQRVSEYAVVTD